jgi:two-component system, chemotaxis family, response regulator PixG
LEVDSIDGILHGGFRQGGCNRDMWANSLLLNRRQVRFLQIWCFGNMIINSSEKIVQDDLSFQAIVSQFKNIKAQEFSGHFIVKMELPLKWTFFFNLGKLSWISGGIDPVSRWQRNLGLANLDLSRATNVESSSQNQVLINSCLRAQQWLAIEVLFDMIQICQCTDNRLSYQLISIDPELLGSNPNLPLLNIEPLIATAVQTWEEWKSAGLADYFPSRFPSFDRSEISSEIGILNQAQLSELTTIDNLPEILLSIDGNKSLRTLAIDHRQNLLDFTKILLPLLQSGSITLSSLQIDLPKNANR